MGRVTYNERDEREPRQKCNFQAAGGTRGETRDIVIAVVVVVVLLVLVVVLVVVVEGGTCLCDLLCGKLLRVGTFISVHTCRARA